MAMPHMNVMKDNQREGRRYLRATLLGGYSSRQHMPALANIERTSKSE